MTRARGRGRIPTRQFTVRPPAVALPNGRGGHPRDPLTTPQHAMLHLTRQFGDGWAWTKAGARGYKVDNARLGLRVIVTAAEFEGATWTHSSISVDKGHDALPSWYDMKALKNATIGADRYAYQVFASDDGHYSYAEVLHLWACHDGDGRVLPDFAIAGGI